MQSSIIHTWYSIHIHCTIPGTTDHHIILSTSDSDSTKPNIIMAYFRRLSLIRTSRLGKSIPVYNLGKTNTAAVTSFETTCTSSRAYNWLAGEEIKFNKKHVHLNTNNIIGNPKTQLRLFGKKAGRMGQHLKNLDEIAHREHNKKKGKKGNRSEEDAHDEPATTSFEVEDITLVEDENETKFDHGGDDEDEAPSLPSKDDVQQRMMKVVNSMDDSFRSIRGAEPSAELFDNVQVKAYGAMTPLNAVGQVVITSPTMATISCFDPETSASVRDAVRDMAGMNFNPRIEDGAVIVPIPRVSAETRKVCQCNDLLYLFMTSCVDTLHFSSNM